MDMEKLLTHLCEKGMSGSVSALDDAVQVCKNIERENSIEVTKTHGDTLHTVYNPEKFEFAHNWIKKVREASLECLKHGGGEDAVKIYYDTHLFDAPFVFDSFMLFIEHGRPKEQQFWLPRRKKIAFSG